MSFLKKLGEVLLTAGASAVGFGPLIAPLFGSGGAKVGQEIAAVSNDLTSIGSTVIQIEVALNGKSGAEKLAAAVNLIGPIIRTSELVAGKQIADPALLTKGIQEITQGVVDVLNSVHADSVKTVVKAPGGH
jgi:hypothetical protein